MFFALHSRSYDVDQLPAFKIIFQELQQRQSKFIYFKDFALFLKKSGLVDQKVDTFEDYHNLPNVDFILSIGGDGTLLETVTFVRDKNIPIIGINIGRLGFLSTISTDKIPQAIDNIFQSAYTLDRRNLIALHTEKDLFNGLNFALNEFAVFKRDTSSMIIIHAYLDGEFLNSYWADGLIVSTPTGSTGYSLSVGGPIVMPHSNSFIIMPVSPHNLAIRPLIVSNEAVLSFEIERRGRSFLASLDSRSIKVVDQMKMTVKKCCFSIQLVTLKDVNFLNTLRLKLNWGYDTRNYQ